jgi:hypothetical protein
MACASQRRLDSSGVLAARKTTNLLGDRRIAPSNGPRLAEPARRAGDLGRVVGHAHRRGALAAALVSANARQLGIVRHQLVERHRRRTKAV